MTTMAGGNKKIKNIRGKEKEVKMTKVLMTVCSPSKKSCRNCSTIVLWYLIKIQKLNKTITIYFKIYRPQRG